MDFKHEFVMPNDDLPFRMFVFEGYAGNYAVEKHWHRSVEIFTVFEGEIRFFINEEAYQLQPRDFVLLNSNEIHSISSLEKNMTIVLQIPIKVFEDYYTEEQFILFSHSPRVQDEQITKLIETMYRNYKEHKLGYELKVQSQFFMLVYLLVTKYRVQDVSIDVIRNSKQLSRLSMITDYIQENYTQDITLEGLAKIFGYSTAYLSRMFRKYAMMNYRTYIQNVRLEFAYKEMINSRDTISNIAGNNGFPNSKSFTKAFRKKYGILPSDYRQRNSEGQKSAID